VIVLVELVEVALGTRGVSVEVVFIGIEKTYKAI
jgi:hypothetical protein